MDNGQSISKLSSNILLSGLELNVNPIMLINKNGIILWANKSFFQSTGYQPQEIIGKNTNILKSNRHDSVFFDALWKTILSGNAWKGEIINKRKDGSLYIVEMTITPIIQNDEITHFIAITQDITDIKLKTLELKNREAQLAYIINKTHDFIFAFSDEGKIFFANPALLSALEYEENELYDLDIFSIVSEQSKNTIHSFIQQESLDTRTNLIDISFITKTAKIIMSQGSFIPYYVNNRLTSIWASFSDLTHKKRLEKMQEEFISIITHDIKTPLASIKSSLNLLSKNILNENFNHHAKELLDITISNVDRLTRLATSILEAAKLENNNFDIKLEPIKLIDALSSITHQYQELAKEKNISILLNIPSALPEFLAQIQTMESARVNSSQFISSDKQPIILADKDKLAQILSNLLSNAIKFAYPNSEIKIAITTNHQNATIPIENSEPIEQTAVCPYIHQNVTISIENYGPPIPQELHSKLFEKFTHLSSNSNYEGAGLGLYISKLLTNIMKGKIYFKSSPENITTFYLEFPTYNGYNATDFFNTEQLNYEENLHCIQNDYSPQLSKILVIDDDFHMQKIIKLALELLGNFIVESCSSPELAIEKAVDFKPDLIILDEIMPKITGTQFLQQLKTHPTLSQIPVILTSAKLNINDLNNYKDLGVINIINKPFDPNIIHKTVLNSWLNYNKTKLNKY